MLSALRPTLYYRKRCRLAQLEIVASQLQYNSTTRPSGLDAEIVQLYLMEQYSTCIHSAYILRWEGMSADDCDGNMSKVCMREHGQLDFFPLKYQTVEKVSINTSILVALGKSMLAHEIKHIQKQY